MEFTVGFGEPAAVSRTSAKKGSASMDDDMRALAEKHQQIHPKKKVWSSQPSAYLDLNAEQSLANMFNWVGS